jgi:2-polyprenyl-3-methyl-5-hydroxy-6-metoxy-1,4-benzoquinol methylase
MAQTIRRPTSDDVATFYDALAPNYDEMTGFQKRFVHEKPFFRLLVEKYGIASALDAGCGTGFHTLLLAQLGVKVTGIDLSREMVRRAELHARELGLLEVEFLQASFQAPLKKKQFDAVFCLGNSLAHVLKLEDLRATLKNFAQMLAPGKIVFLQNLNYDRILAQQERIQSIKESNGTTYIRFYDYGEETLEFNILTIGKLNSSVEQQFQSTTLRPWRETELRSLLQETGFDEIKSYGGISMEEFHPGTSKDLVILARKSG